jgi:hypothetical protein
MLQNGDVMARLWTMVLASCHKKLKAEVKAKTKTEGMSPA